jgi:YD repeat-containing protein
MTRRNAFLCSVISLVLACCLSCPVNAQQQCFTQGMSQTDSLSGQAPVPPIPENAVITGSGNWETYWIVLNDQCHPVPECPTCNKAGLPIDLSSGDVDISQTDLRVPGLSGGLSLVRTWNSVWPSMELGLRVGLFGANWKSTYEDRVFLGNDGYMKYARSDGGFWSFGFTGYDSSGNDPVYAPTAPANESATLTQYPTSWGITFKNGETRTFDGVSGFLTSIVDRNGNTTSLAYDNAYRLVTVTDPASRHLYFTYSDPSTYLVTGVSSDVGISLAYSYDSQGRLTSVTMPDSTTVSYQYDSNDFITAVLDTNGKVLESHTYDAGGKGLTSSRAGGVDSITVSYPQPPPVRTE